MSATSMPKDYANNPIKLLHRLVAAGFTQKQAEAQVEVLSDYTEGHLVAKKDLKEFELRLTIRLVSVLSAVLVVLHNLDKFF